ncbi:hypothetical protein CF392_15255, partial [Tamilnaduibacter salinus]
MRIVAAPMESGVDDEVFGSRALDTRLDEYANLYFQYSEEEVGLWRRRAFSDDECIEVLTNNDTNDTVVNDAASGEEIIHFDGKKHDGSRFGLGGDWLFVKPVSKDDDNNTLVVNWRTKETHVLEGLCEVKIVTPEILVTSFFDWDTWHRELVARDRTTLEIIWSEPNQFEFYYPLPERDRFFRASNKLGRIEIVEAATGKVVHREDVKISMTPQWIGDQLCFRSNQSLAFFDPSRFELRIVTPDVP